MPGRIGIEVAEREHFAWLKDLIIEKQEPELHHLTTRQAAIARAMAGFVRPWRDHYIAYETTPAIDSYFEDLGILHARTLLGQDSFPGHALFGGHEFNLYRATAGILAGIALKHRNFCYALLNKQPEIEPRNIFAIPRPVEDMIQDFAFVLGVDGAMARQALETLTLTVDNKSHHCASSSAGYFAPLITVGREHVLLSTLGCLDSPFYFMLGELRRRYRADWDKATNLREEVFRRELYQLFPLPHMLEIQRSIMVRANGKTVTDIDALVFDRNAGVLGLFQLKWQDPFGGSLRQRASRKKNFFGGANGWVEGVDQWIRNRDLAEIGQALGMKRTDASRIRQVRLFVIGRNFSNFSGNDIPDERAAWGLWPQVLRLVHDKPGNPNPVDALFRALKEDAPALGSLTWTSIDQTRIHLKGKTITLVLQPHFIIQSTAFRPASVVTAACIGLPSSTPL
ncbi:MAG: hypothetical protein H0U55_04915 [Rubrobacteraceae bacterium]|nr:hypothetical protein [Rubrobacteraceae bacterium]